MSLGSRVAGLFLIATALLFAPSAFAGPSVEPPSVQPNLVGVGGECDATVHTGCSHWSADGACHLFVGGQDGRCVVYGGDAIVASGGQCHAMVHTNCWHITAPGRCAVYMGGPDGACIVY